jgi:hypothetical protein
MEKPDRSGSVRAGFPQLRQDSEPLPWRIDEKTKILTYWRNGKSSMGNCNADGFRLSYAAKYLDRVELTCQLLI